MDFGQIGANVERAERNGFPGIRLMEMATRVECHIPRILDAEFLHVVRQQGLREILIVQLFPARHCLTVIALRLLSAATALPSVT